MGIISILIYIITIFSSIFVASTSASRVTENSSDPIEEFFLDSSNGSFELEVSNKSKTEKQIIMEVAKILGIPEKELVKEIEIEEFTDKVDSDLKLAKDLKVNETPSIFINNNAYNGSRDFETISAFINAIEGNVSLTVFSDFNCPHCAEFYPITIKLENEFKEKIKIEHKAFPFLAENSYTYAVIAKIAEDKGKFKEVTTYLYQEIHKARLLDSNKYI